MPITKAGKRIVQLASDPERPWMVEQADGKMSRVVPDALVEQAEREAVESALSEERIADLIHDGKIAVGPWRPSRHVALACRRIEDLQEARSLRAALLAPEVPTGSEGGEG